VAHGGCLRALARAGEIDDGVITLGEAAAGAAGSDDVVVLEHAATVLAPEPAHRRNIADSELRPRRDLVEHLLAGTDTDSAQDRARALGHDLERPHGIVVVRGGTRAKDPDAVFHAVRRAACDHGTGALLVAPAGVLALLAETDGDWAGVRTSVVTELSPGGSCRVRISAPSTEVGNYPRAYRQAQLALKMQVQGDAVPGEGPPRWRPLAMGTLAPGVQPTWGATLTNSGPAAAACRAD
jgi:hypothetical protein